MCVTVSSGSRMAGPLLSLLQCVLLALAYSCPVGQYPADSTNAATVCLQCPAHTRTVEQANVAMSAHDCKCDPGFLCMYYRQVHATVSLNATLSDFENDVHNVRSSFLAGVASAAGVSSAQVHVHYVVIRLNHRRRLHDSSGGAVHESIRVSVMVSGTSNEDSLLKLHRHLSSLQMITDSWVVRKHVLVIGSGRE